MVTKQINGVTFEFESPSLFRPQGLPVEIRYVDDSWRVNMLWKDRFTSGEYPTREAAIAVISEALYGRR
jgi:hypothetical protein